MVLDIKSFLLNRESATECLISEPWPEELVSFQGMDLLDPLRLELKVVQEGEGRLSLSGKAIIAFKATCARCNDPVHKEMEVALQARYLPQTSRRKTDWLQEEEFESNADDEEERYFYKGTTLNLEPWIANSVLPELPLRMLCREECKGLCPSCGANRNHTSCTCKSSEPENQSPFSGLRDLLDF